MSNTETEAAIKSAARHLAKALGAIRKVDPALATFLGHELADSMDAYRKAIVALAKAA